MNQRISPSVPLLLYIQHAMSQNCCSKRVALSHKPGLPNGGKNVLRRGFNDPCFNLNTLNAGSDKFDNNFRKRVINLLVLGFWGDLDKRFSGDAYAFREIQNRSLGQFGNEKFTESKRIVDAVPPLDNAIGEGLGANSSANFATDARVRWLTQILHRSAYCFLKPFPGINNKFGKAIEDRIIGSKAPNTGEEWLFLLPEITSRITKEPALAFRLELPIYSYLARTQHTPNIRISNRMNISGMAEKSIPWLL